MNKREQKICNYFIILQLTKYNRITAKNLFMKYIHLLDKPFQDCIFDFSYDDKKILLKYSDEMIFNSYSVLNNNLNKDEINQSTIDYEDITFVTTLPDKAILYF